MNVAPPRDLAHRLRLSGPVGAVLLAVVALCGCNSANDPAPPPTPPRSAGPMHLLVVDDPALAARIGRYRGEWKALAGVELVISEAKAGDIKDKQSLDCDAVILPSERLGSLVEATAVRPLGDPRQIEETIRPAELIEPAGVAELKWGGEFYAAPLGSPVFVCFYRRDLLEQLHRQPPKTLDEYTELARLLDDRQKLASADASEDWHGAVEPAAPGWGAKLLLAHAAAYAKHRDYLATLWDADTMAPRIASPPFLRALEQLCATAQGADGKRAAALWLNSAPADARRAIITGHCGLAISWPSAAKPTDDPAPKETVAALVDVCQLPGATEAYNPTEKAWQKRPAEDDIHVPLLAVAGRIACVSKGAKSPEVARRLLAWLSTQPTGSQISPASPATAPYRREQLSGAARWCDLALSPSAVKQYAAALEAALGSEQWLMVPRLPGQQEYMSALDDAVRKALDGSLAAQAALDQAADAWQKITDRLGRDRQREAYRRSLGL